MIRAPRFERAAMALLTASSLILSMGAVPAAAAGPTAPRAHSATVTPRYQGKVSGRAIAGLAARPHRSLAIGARPADLKSTPSTGKSVVVNGSRSPLVVGPPVLTATHTMFGVNQDTVGGLEPPDPWVAANGSFVVGSANGLVSVLSRAGTPIASMPTWALFAMDGASDSDPRILWDATHGRWVGVEVGYDAPDFQNTFLSIIVSDTADPLGTWRVLQYGYGPDLPDYPGIATSSDKIVLAVNEFAGGATFLETSYLVLPWASILNGTPTTPFYHNMTPVGGGTEDFGLRPARLTTAGSDVWMVYEDGTTGTLHTFRIHGTGTAAVPTGDTNLGFANGIPNLDHAPRQPGDPDGISGAEGASQVNSVDSRVTDAVQSGTKVIFTRTGQTEFVVGSPDLTTEILSFDTSSPATLKVSFVFGAAGVDTFMSGIGASTNGTRFATASQSSALANPSIVAWTMPPGFAWSSMITVASSDSAYDGTRWGDYAGIASDPLGSSSAWMEHQVSVGGKWQTVISRLVADSVAPTFTGHPAQALVTGTTVADTIPVRISWPAATDAGSGIASYRLREAGFGGPLLDVASTTGRTVTRGHFWSYLGAPIATYRYQVQALDDAGNSSAIDSVRLGSAVVFDQSQSGYTWSSGWTTSSASTSYVGGRVKYSSRVGASVSFRTTLMQSVGFVTYRSSTPGKVKIYVDGALKKTLTLTSSTVKARNIAWSTSFATAGTHTIKLVVVSGRVKVDAFAVIR